MGSPPGVRVLAGIPQRCGLRAGDVVVDWLALGSLVYTYGRKEGDASVDLDPFDWSLSWRGRNFVGPLPPGPTTVAPGFTVERVEQPPLISEPRFLHGHWVIGPRGITRMYESVRVHWDIVDADAHRRLSVEDTGDGEPPAVTEYVLEPRGLDLEQLGPSAERNDDGDTILTPGRFGTPSAEVAKRLALELALRQYDQAWIGWDGVIRTTSARGGGGDRTPLEIFVRLHFSTHLEEGRFARAPRFMQEAFEAAEPASDAQLADVVRGLRPDWTRVRLQYTEELAILADDVKRRSPP